MAVRRRRRTTRRNMTTKQRRYFGNRKRSPARKRRRTRSNWISPGMVAAVNPRKRRTRSRKARVHHRRKGYRRNPAFMGFELPAIKSVVFAGVGFAGPSFVQGLLSQMAPSLLAQTSAMGVMGKYIIKGGSVLGLSWLTKRFVGSSEANMVLIGGGLNIGLSLVNDFAPGILPPNPLAMYSPVMAQPQLQAYQPIRPGLRAIPSAAPFRNVTASSPYGTAGRYYRY